MRTILVSNRLPLSAGMVDGNIRLTPSAGGLATGLRGLREDCGATWIGWAGELPELTAGQADELRSQFAERGARPVLLTPQEVEGYYRDVSNGVIWPLFHYLLDQLPPHVQGWDQFRAVNQKFADAAIDEYRDGDVIWVHDYQLMLVPAMIRRRLSDARIGFFLHVPFPSSEVFSICPWREEILKGLLGADLIGFHTPAYMRHFTTSLRRILGVETNVGRIRRGAREIGIGVFPMGIDAAGWAKRADDPAVTARAEQIREESGGRKLIVGIDRLDYTKGLRHRLLAIEALLKEDPSLGDRLRVIQVTVPSRESIEAYASLREDVDGLVGRINSTYATAGSVPIHHLHHAMGEQEVSALYRAADVMLVTPLRDGMNLVAKEFAASRTDEDGVLILSEFAGAAAELGEAIRVNPYDVEGVATAIRTAFEMPAEERKTRMHAIRERVAHQDVHRWAQSFVDALRSIPQHAPMTEHSSDVATLIQRLGSAGPVELVLDYDGTLVPFAATPEAAAPDAELLDLLGALTARPDTAVHIVTGRSRTSIGRWLGDLPLHISAEHGLWTRQRPGDDWEMLRPVAVEWKARLRPILRHFVDATAGTMIEEKTASLVWHYRLADDEFGEFQARELRLLLGELLSNSPVEILSSHKAVEIKAQGVSKADAVATLLELGDLGNATVVAIGDDQSDEDCFPVLPEGSVTVHVNGGASKAGYRVADPADVRRILRAVATRPTESRAALAGAAL